jgi:hypothetical protein
MNTRSQADFMLNYDEVFRYISNKYTHLFKDAKSSQVKDEKNRKLYLERYKNCRYVLTEFLNLYTSLREKSANSLANTALWGFQKAASLITLKNAKTTQDVLDMAIRDIRQNISTVSTFQDVLRLLIDLRKYAEICQEQKLLSGPSVLCMTLHAMACYLVLACKNDFKDLVEGLEKERIELLVKPKEDFEKCNQCRSLK